MRKLIKAVHVHAIRASAPHGVLVIGHRTIPCALGRAGVRARKCEGDGATPLGRWRLVKLLWRPDRRRVPPSAIPSRVMRKDMGWCDAPADRNYNRPVRLPYSASHEELWRGDGLYDLVITLSHNMRPRVARLGSAVFFHLASPDLKPTAGCVAIRPADVARVLPWFGPQTGLVVGGSVRPRRDGQRSPNRPAHGLPHRQ